MSVIKPYTVRCFMFPSYHFYDGIDLRNAFHKLKRLSVYGAYIGVSNIDSFSSRFPLLEDLAIHNCNMYRSIKISSSSLQCITYTYDKRGKFRLEFDVPRISKFTFSAVDVPVLLFGPTESKWESNISILSDNPPHTGWYLQLSKLLKNLSPSKVSLELKFLSKISYIGSRDFRDVTDKPEVENLTVIGPEDLDSYVFKSLLECCRPIYVSQYVFPKKSTGGEPKTKRKTKRKVVEEEYDFSQMIQHYSFWNSCTAYQRKTEEEEEGESDLEEVCEEYYDESVSAWLPRSLDTSTALGAADERRIRFHLKWRR